jgi:hypothetical protein
MQSMLELSPRKSINYKLMTNPSWILFKVMMDGPIRLAKGCAKCFRDASVVAALAFVPSVIEVVGMDSQQTCVHISVLIHGSCSNSPLEKFASIGLVTYETVTLGVMVFILSASIRGVISPIWKAYKRKSDAKKIAGGING